MGVAETDEPLRGELGASSFVVFNDSVMPVDCPRIEKAEDVIAVGAEFLSAMRENEEVGGLSSTPALVPVVLGGDLEADLAWKVDANFADHFERVSPGGAEESGSNFVEADGLAGEDSLPLAFGVRRNVDGGEETG